jgi:hypothetical protein
MKSFERTGGDRSRQRSVRPGALGQDMRRAALFTLARRLTSRCPAAVP